MRDAVTSRPARERARLITAARSRLRAAARDLAPGRRSSLRLIAFRCVAAALLLQLAMDERP